MNLVTLEDEKGPRGNREGDAVSARHVGATETAYSTQTDSP